jgi:FkbM family methyltransferase
VDRGDVGAVERLQVTGSAVKVAEGRTLGDPETIHFGLVPRTNRGIFAINELPDLAERIQVALLNVLEERDIQVRGYTLRLPLDLLVMASANPEDYTNRGRIITPMKDRFGAEITTHYPYDVQHEIDLIAQEGDLVAVVPRHLLEVIARFTRLVRESGAVDQRSGVSARFAIAAAEALAGAALRRAAITGDEAVARIGDLAGVVPTLRGKVEFEVSEEGREEEVLQHLARNIQANALDSRISIRPCAASHCHGSLMFDPGPEVQTGWGGLVASPSHSSVEVAVTKLDSEFSDIPIDLLKIDVEGADTWVLRGCESLLARRLIKKIVFEQNRSRMTALGIHPEEAASLLRSAGYECVSLDSTEESWLAIPK